MKQHNVFMALLDIVIEVLKINCSVVQCSGYASEIEALFYLLFFPAVFIILLVYVVSGVILEKAGGKEGALRLLIGVTMVAFVIFQGWYTFFVSLSKIWWILVVGIVGLFVFIKKMVHGGGGGSGFGTARRGGGGLFGIGGTVSEMKERVKINANPYEHKKIKGLCRGVEASLEALANNVNEYSSMPTGEAKSEFVKTIKDDERDAEQAIRLLDRALDENPSLKKHYDKFLDSYRDECGLLRKREKAIKKRRI